MKFFAPIIMIFLVLTMFGCSTRMEDKTLTDDGKALKFAECTLKVIVKDSCEYLLGNWGNATFLTHKGNCKYCKERNK